MGKLGRIKRGITGEFLKNRIKAKLENAGSEAQWSFIQKIEQVYALTGKPMSAHLLNSRKEAIEELKGKGFLCKVEGCEERAKENGFCKTHNPINEPTETDTTGH